MNLYSYLTQNFDHNIEANGKMAFNVNTIK